MVSDGEGKQVTSKLSTSDLEAMVAVFDELYRARELHPAWPRDAIHAAAIVAEESGELIRAAINREYGRGLDRAACDSEMRKEAIHTAATAIRFLVGG